MTADTPRTHEELLRAIISHFLKLGAKASEDARWFVSILSDDLLRFFRAEVLAAIREKAGDPTKARKIFLSLGRTGKQIFGLEYADTKKKLDAESRVAIRTAAERKSITVPLEKEAP